MNTPTGSDRSAQIRAQDNPIVMAYADQLKKLGVGSVDFLNRLDVYQKAYSRGVKVSAGALSSLEISRPSGKPTRSSASEPMVLKAAQELTDRLRCFKATADQPQ